MLILTCRFKVQEQSVMLTISKTQIYVGKTSGKELRI